MNRAWLIVLTGLVFFSAGVWAQATITIDNGPYAINPNDDLNVDFTYTNPSYIGFATETFYFWLSDDNTFNNGNDINLSSLEPFTWGSMPSCDDNLVATTGMPCTHSFVIGTHADGNYYLFAEVTDENGVSLGNSSGVALSLTTPDTTPPTGSIASNLTLTAGATTNTLPSFTVNIIGNDVNTSSFVFTIDSNTIAGATLVNGVYDYNVTSPLVDKSYTVTVAVSDLSGNAATITPYTFTVDTQAPIFTVSVSNSWTNDETPTISFTANDALINLTGGVTAHIRCTNAPQFTDYNMSGTSLNVDTFDVTAGSCGTGDGNKTIEVNVTDVLGHSATQQSIGVLYDNTGPSTPTGFEYDDRTSTTIDLDWFESSDASSGVSDYRIYRSTSNSMPGSPVHTVSHPTSLKQDTGLTACTTYYYWIDARDRAGNNSAPSSNPLQVTTDGCSSSSNNNSNNSGGSGGGGGGGGSGGGGGGGSCNVTFDVPASIYAGEKITATVQGNSYVNGYFRATPTGKATIAIQKVGTSASKWTGTFDVPNLVGTTVKFVFGTDSCTATTSRVIKDISTKPAASPVANPAPVNNGNTTNPTNTVLENEPVLPEPVLLNVGMEQLTALLSAAGFNADNAQLVSDAQQAITEWNAQPIVKMVPVEGEKGKYALQYVLTLQNTGNKGSVKIVVDVPKSFAKTASEFTSNVNMTVLKDDPLVQFEVSELFEGQAVEIVLTSANTYTFGVAQSKMEALQALIVNPPILFSSGVGKAVANKEAGQPLFDGSNLMTGLVGFVGNIGPLVLGFLLVVGLIFVSIRVVKGSVEGADNPILRSSVGVRNTGPVHRTSTPVRGSKMWKSDSSSRIGRY